MSITSVPTPCFASPTPLTRAGRWAPARTTRKSRVARETAVDLFELLGLGGVGRALERTGQLAELRSPAPFTMLAPSDAALAELPAELLDQPALLARLLAFHLIPGERVDRERLRAEPGLTTATGQRVHVECIDSEDGEDGEDGEAGGTGEPELLVDGARLLQTDLRVGAGVVHVIDRVLLPAELDLIELLHLSDAFPRLLAACEVLGLEDVLRGSLPYTLLAPRGLETLPTWEWHALLRPEARARLEALVRRHLVAGRVYLDPGASLRNLEGEALELAGPRASQRVAGRRVAVAEIEARNGLVHVIDGLLGA